MVVSNTPEVSPQAMAFEEYLDYINQDSKIKTVVNADQDHWKKRKGSSKDIKTYHAIYEIMAADLKWYKEACDTGIVCNLNNPALNSNVREIRKYWYSSIEQFCYCLSMLRWSTIVTENVIVQANLSDG